ncbi:hypothetical protein C7B67_23680 [filamentous cyanobacterium Phorm 6]|nr:hypothetical protein C7B67_23680 [filamentous cyanobacterium Phorm 6]
MGTLEIGILRRQFLKNLSRFSAESVKVVILNGLDSQFPKTIKSASVNGQQFDSICLFPIVDYERRSHHAKALIEDKLV